MRVEKEYDRICQRLSDEGSLEDLKILQLAIRSNRSQAASFLRFGRTLDMDVPQADVTFPAVVASLVTSIWCSWVWLPCCNYCLLNCCDDRRLLSAATCRLTNPRARNRRTRITRRRTFRSHSEWAGSPLRIVVRYHTLHHSAVWAKGIFYERIPPNMIWVSTGLCGFPRPYFPDMPLSNPP